MDKAQHAKALATARVNAVKALVAAHSSEYEERLHAEYERLGVTPKRARALSPEEKARRVAEKKAAAEARRAEKRAAKIAALQAELEALTQAS